MKDKHTHTHTTIPLHHNNSLVTEMKHLHP